MLFCKAEAFTGGLAYRKMLRWPDTEDCASPRMREVRTTTDGGQHKHVKDNEVCGTSPERSQI